MNHSVLEFSDRDIVRYYRSVNDLNGSKKLNRKLIEVVSNYLPDLIVLGHADLINANVITPGSVMEIVDICREAGVPSGVVNLLSGDPAGISPAKHIRVRNNH